MLEFYLILDRLAVFSPYASYVLYLDFYVNFSLSLTETHL